MYVWGNFHRVVGSRGLSPLLYKRISTFRLCPFVVLHFITNSPVSHVTCVFPSESVDMHGTSVESLGPGPLFSFELT